MKETIKKENFLTSKTTEESSKINTSNKSVSKPASSQNHPSSKTQENKKRQGQRSNSFRRQPREFDQKLIDISRVTNVVKGGRRFSFTALVAIGNKKGNIGLGYGKSNEIPDAIKKAVKNAQKTMIIVPIEDKRTIPHEQKMKFCASNILIKSAPKGTGIIASGTVRSIVELAGYQDIYTKSLGSRNKKNIAKATFLALKNLKTPKNMAILRDRELNEIR